VSLFNLDGRVVIITGGTGLLGREYAFAVARAGGRAVVADLDEATAAEVAKRVTEETGCPALGVAADVTSKDSIGDVVGRVLDTFGTIDGLINNAAINPRFDAGEAGKHVLTFEDYPLEMWQQSLNVNITGMFLCCQAVAPVMLAQGRGAIVNVSSTYGITGPDQRLYDSGEGNQPPSLKPVDYSVSKAAVIGLTRYLAAYWGDKGIRVNTFTPGGVRNDQDAGFVERYSSRTPMHRMARRDEYCGAIVFLLAEASSYMTGGNLVVDGGWTAW
jgi:NAD(P)-dependent dehydrogenase (short-subunit alcohol dehydrogenase family)